MFQDKHGIHYYADEPDSTCRRDSDTDVKRTESNGLDCSILFFEGFNGIASDDKVTYLSNKIQELKTELQREQVYKQNIFNELEEQEAKEQKLMYENKELRKTVS